MCCFTQPVQSVSRTRIYGWAPEPGRQRLVYSMRLASAGDVAMVLPIPVPPRSAEDAVKFIDLSRYPDFFGRLDRAFEPPQRLSNGELLPPAASAPLKIERVGSFDASFVPTREDFGRLDERFRLPADVLDRIPHYADWGFAVFKLRVPMTPPTLWQRLTGIQAPRSFHPMAFDFPSRSPERVFFPTMHVHDGAVHPKARFDHVLYCEPTTAEAPTGWERSHQTPYVPAVGAGTLYRRKWVGRFANEDIWV